jgi:uncharacterized membrane protein
LTDELDTSEADETPDPLTRPVDRALVKDLYAANVLTPGARDAAYELIRPPSGWWTLASRLLTGLGAGLMLAGVVFFFAYNWADLRPAMKFGLIQGGLAACLIGAFVVGVDRLGGKLLLSGCTVFVGVFLAVHGQVYQTGADSFELFVRWSILIIPFAILSRFEWNWLLWLVVTNVGIILYWQQVRMPTYGHQAEGLFLTLGVLNTAVLMLGEWARQAETEEAPGRVTRMLTLTAALTCLVSPALILVVDTRITEGDQPGMRLVGTVVYLAALVGGAWFYGHRKFDLLALLLCTLSLCVLLLTWIGRLIFDTMNWDEAMGFMLFGLIILAVVSIAALALLKVWRSKRRQEHAA